MKDELESKQPDRTHPVHGIRFVSGQPTVIFDTVCTKDRKQWLANDQVHQILKNVWMGADAWLMGRYVVMPDHIHFFAWFTGSLVEYQNWVKYWKSQFSKKYKHADCQWQTDSWDMRLRSFVQYEEKWLYVKRNPTRHGLVMQVEEWPYQGEIHDLRWQ
jgi:putative transposase